MPSLVESAFQPSPGMNAPPCCTPTVLPFLSGSANSLPRRNADSGAMNDAFVDHGPNVLMPSARARQVYRASVVSSSSTS